MKNTEIRALLDRIKKGYSLNSEEQTLVLRKLLRANQRIQEASRAGFSTSGSASGSGENWEDAQGSSN